MIYLLIYVFNNTYRGNLSLMKMCHDICSRPSVIELEQRFRSCDLKWDDRPNPPPSRAAEFMFRAIRLKNKSRGRAPKVLWRRTNELFECASFAHNALSRCVSS